MADANSDGERMIRSAVSRFERPLFLYALKIAGDPERARDAVQETFATLCGDPPADVNGRLAEWLYTVCRNKALDARRKERRMKLVGDVADETIAMDSPTPADVIEQRDSSDRMLVLLAKLPENQQEVLRLKFQHQMSYRQISQITGHSESNVGFLIHTGLKTLRARMK